MDPTLLGPVQPRLVWSGAGLWPGLWHGANSCPRNLMFKPEALECILTWTGMDGGDFFNAKSGKQAYAVLHRGVPDAEKGHLCDDVGLPYVDVQAAVNDAFTNGEDRKRREPLQGSIFTQPSIDTQTVDETVDCTSWNLAPNSRSNSRSNS